MHITVCRGPESLSVAEWAALRPGDVVRCVNAEHAAPRLELGKQYVVVSTRVSNDGECSINVGEGGNFAGRFALATPTHTDALLKAFQGT